MSAARSRFSGFSSRSGRGNAAGAVIACAVMLLAGCGGSGEAESGAPVIRGDVTVALTVSNSTTTGTVGTPITLTSAGGSATDRVSFTTTTGCTAIGASLSATTAGLCIVTATQVTQTSPAVTFTFTAADAATSSAGVPSSPLNPRLTSTGPTTMTVWFDAPPNNGSVITSYQATSTAGAITGTVTGAESSSGILVTGLTTGETYRFKVTATNAVGTSAYAVTRILTAGSEDCKAPASTNVNWAYCVMRELALKHTNLTGANLTGASINGADVNHTDFTDANLTDVDLQGTYGAVAKFTRANLTRANLTCGNANGTMCSDLLNANLTDANLTDAQLTGVSNLKTVTWTGATCPNKLKGPYPCSLSTTVTVATVTFDPNDGDGSIASQIATGATLLTANNGAIKRTGFAFNGWNTSANGNANGNGTAYANLASYPFTADATLYAKWGCLPLSVTASAERLTKDRGKVRWTASSSESPWTTFMVTTVGGGWPTTVSQSSDTGSKTVTGLLPFQSYAFTVKATNEGGCSYTSSQSNRVAAVS